jgi:hypothetical protein
VCRLETLRRADRDSERGMARPLVEGIEQSLHLEVGERELIPQPSRE